MKKIITLIVLVMGIVGTAMADDTWTLEGNFGENYSWITAGTFSTVDGDYSVTMNLSANQTYQFGVKKNNGEFYKNSGTMNWYECRNWEFKTGDNNCNINTSAEGSYKFILTFPGSTPYVTVSYPLSAHTVYFYNHATANEWTQWTAPYAYILGASYWDENKGSGSSGRPLGVAMTQVSEGSYIWKADIRCPADANYIAFVDGQHDNAGDFWDTKAAYLDNFSTSTPFYVPNTSSPINKNYTDNNSKWTAYYNSGTWLAYPYTRTVSSGNFGTICLPFDATVEGATLFTITSKTEDANHNLTGLNLTSVESITAGVPYIFKATSGVQSFSYTGSSYDTTDNPTSGNMKGNLSSDPLDVALNDYIIKDNQLRKVASGGAATVGQYKACILNSIESLSVGARGVDYIGFNGEAEGIDEVESTMNIGGIFYNLAGQRVVQPTKGLYIVNGKKVLSK